MPLTFSDSGSTHLVNLKITEKAVMDSIFVLGEEDRAAFFHHLIQSFGCTYICLWSFLPSSNCLLFLDGVYVEERSQKPSSTSGSLARSLFFAYSKSVNYVDLGRVPGFAMRNNVPYIEMKLLDLQRLTSTQVQLQFYQEAGIKTMLLMGCSSGEIELGFSTEPHVNMEFQMRNWFPNDFSSQTPSPDLPQPTSQNTSSALSVDHVEYSPSLLDIPSPHQQAMQERSQIGNIQFPTIESEVPDAMTKAILAVLSSSSRTSNSSSHHQTPYQNVTHNMFGKAVSFLTNLNPTRSQDLPVEENQPSSSRRQHVISERRRREKIKKGFDILRSLLPPGTKKDKQSVLSSTTEYISVLQSEADELIRRNLMLERQLLTATGIEAGVEIGLSSSSERVNVESARVSPSTSEEKLFDLRVTLRLGECRTLDLVIGVLEFLKQQRNVSLLSLQSNTRMMESSTVHGVVFRLKVEGDDFDESNLQEAVRRIVDGQPH